MENTFEIIRTPQPQLEKNRSDYIINDISESRPKVTNISYKNCSLRTICFSRPDSTGSPITNSVSFVSVDYSYILRFYTNSIQEFCINLSNLYPDIGRMFPYKIESIDFFDQYTFAIGGTDGLVHVFRYDESNAIKLFTFNYLDHLDRGVTNSDKGAWINSIKFMPNGSLLIGTSVYVFKINLSNQLEQIIELDKKENESVQVIKYHDNRIIVGTWGGNLYLFDDSGNRIMKDIHSCFVKAMEIDPYENAFYICVGNSTNPVLTKYNLETGAIVQIIRTTSRSWINCIFVTPTHIYLGSNDDIIYEYSKDLVLDKTMHFGFCHCEHILISHNDIIACDSSKIILSKI